MNGSMVRALLLDSLYQVLDNKVFRILGGLTLLMVLMTFAVGARGEELSILFGWFRIPYQDLFSYLDRPFPGLELAGQRVVQLLQSVFVDFLAGVVGMVLAVAATAFFMPALLEKGAADTVFSKPVSRLTLLLSRYVSGLLFVSILAVLLVAGMHVGFLVSSGYSDPGFLWSVLTLIYVFGVLHGVSLLVGVVTRSTVAAILVTMLFMTFNGCVHAGWQAKEAHVNLREPPRRVAAAGDSRVEERDRWQRAFFAVLDVLHFPLPKTNDATLIARGLRQQLELRGYEVADRDSGLRIPAPPEGFARRGGGPPDLSEGVRWVPAGGADGRSLSIRSRPTRARRAEIEALRAEAGRRPGAGEVTESTSRMTSRWTVKLDWTESVEGVVTRHSVHTFLQGSRMWFVEVVGPPEWLDGPAGSRTVEAFLDTIAFGIAPDSRDDYYEYRFGWTAPLRYNTFFSVGSTLAFLLVVLAAAWWRLSRIDF